MPRWWLFLQRGRNRTVLAWLGGGLTVVAAALWTVFVYFDRPPNGPNAGTRPDVEARDGGVAAGGNITGTTITIDGSPPSSGEDDASPRD